MSDDVIELLTEIQIKAHFTGNKDKYKILYKNDESNKKLWGGKRKMITAYIYMIIYYSLMALGFITTGTVRIFILGLEIGVLISQIISFIWYKYELKQKK